MGLFIIIALVLVVLFILAHVSSLLLNLHNNDFFSHFHFVAGFLVTVLFFLLFKNYILALVLTVCIGVIWEFYEWVSWKYFIKKKSFKPERKDTIEDIILDFVGGLLALVILALVAH